MNIEIHQLRYRELLREADHYRVAREAGKTDPPAPRPGLPPYGTPGPSATPATINVTKLSAQQSDSCVATSTPHPAQTRLGPS
ncbi:hypothetical protein RM550_00755 [Streptomyces sp. DSM 41527]|uniref:Uncharacterized protein n=1 Tax=Streptomyces mooreae TaxID=3075523 RepID=A0ABU2SZH8_9ACTN|nr:hypothetical protein [Streptomyces sp. DSM 41527]MDT0454267.1 hypothetical protein [Streptomyces sp. DSM 41527]